VVLNSGGANACTGPEGFADTHRTAEATAAALGVGPIDVAVCSTGLIGARLDMPRLLAGVDAAAAALSPDGGHDAAVAIMTTDTVAKEASVVRYGATAGGMAKGAGMLAPGMATMLSVVTTDASIAPDDAQAALAQAVSLTFNRIDSDGCMSTNDTVILLASGASGATWGRAEATDAVGEVCERLARAMVADAEGAGKDILVRVVGAATADEALDAARSVARSNLFKCAMFGQDPNWGRVASAVGTSAARFDPDQIWIAINGVDVCRYGQAHADPTTVDLSGRDVDVLVDLRAGEESAHIWTNDLTHDYVHENSAYST
jgi:glutamate N-acetyltransferase/amino-acid N-acetyltransferase